MNSIPIQDGDPAYEEWLYFVAWRYNGCKGCTTQINHYRDGTNKLWAEFGADFWAASSQPPPECAKIPADGRVIEETDACFHEAGDSRWWHPGDTGHGGTCVFTYATDAAQADNNATWELRFEQAGRYRVEVYADGGTFGQTRQARYTVTHAGGTTDVLIDQSALDGFQSLGEFDFTTDGGFGVHLGDNTGEPYSEADKRSIQFDAVQVVPAGGDGGGGDDDPDPLGGGNSTGGCRVVVGGDVPGGGSALAALGALVVLAARRRRLRR
jgi:MYXO-CTERM domain-containing protein